MGNVDSSVIRSVRKALRLLDAFGGDHLDFGLTELSDHLGYPKSVTHKLVRTLMEGGFLEQDAPTRRYHIGPGILTVAGAYLRCNPLVREGAAVLQDLARATEHTAALGVLDRGEVLYVAAVEGTRAVKASAHVGDRRPLHATATGKILLSAMSDAEVDALLGAHPLAALTPATITDRFQLKRGLDLVQQTGVAFNLRERSRDASGMAAAVYDLTGRVVAAISLAFPATLQDQRFLDELTKVVVAHAQELSRRLGAPARIPIAGGGERVG